LTQFSFSLYSREIGGQTSVSMILPIFDWQEDRHEPGTKFRTLWLLHGGGGDHTDYLRKTAVERYAVKHQLAVVMPEVGNSFYSDLPHGPRYFTYVSEELPAMLRRYFPLSDKREDNFVAGLSMGGFGAAKLAFNLPDRYAAVGLMSTGPMGPHQLAEVLGDDKRSSRFEAIFGGLDRVPGSINDIWHVLEQAVNRGVELPKIYNCCGTEDFVYGKFREFRSFAERLGLDVTHAEGPGGHTWEFWDEYLPRIIEWLPPKR